MSKIYYLEKTKKREGVHERIIDVAARDKKRKEFEDKVRFARQQTGTWLRYAKWEESQSEFTRARSIYERVLDVEYNNPSIWRRYAEMEIRQKFINQS